MTLPTMRQVRVMIRACGRLLDEAHWVRLVPRAGNKNWDTLRDGLPERQRRYLFGGSPTYCRAWEVESIRMYLVGLRQAMEVKEEPHA